MTPIPENLPLLASDAQDTPDADGGCCGSGCCGGDTSSTEENTAATRSV